MSEQYATRAAIEAARRTNEDSGSCGAVVTFDRTGSDLTVRVEYGPGGSFPTTKLVRDHGFYVSAGIGRGTYVFRILDGRGEGVSA